MSVKLRTYLVYFLGSLTIILMIPCLYIFRKHNRKVRRFFDGLLLKIMGVKLEIRGEPDPDAMLYIINHRSMLDIIVLEALPDKKNFCWIAKRQITDMFYFGHLMKAPKMISVDREDARSLLTLLKEIKPRVEEGRPLMIFPEGTRSFGTGLGPFKPGAKMIGDKFRLKVQPVVLAGTDHCLNSKKLTTHPGTVVVEYLPPMTADKKSEWFEEARTAMEAVYKRNSVRAS